MKDALDDISVQVRLFGGLVLTCGENTLRDTGRRGKVWDLLEFLLVNRKRGYSTENLVELLCQDESVDNPMSIIKNLAYRLRKLLDQAQFPAREYIIYQQGVYSWNPNIPCTIDCEEFEGKWKRAESQELCREERLGLYLDAIELYTGRFLPKSISREWVVPLSAYYHRLYIECIRGVFQILSQSGSLEQMVDICNRAIIIDPYEENLYEMLIESLISLGRYMEALDIYDRITGILFNELGITPSSRIRGLYNEITKSIQPVEKDIREIHSDLTESLSPVRGAFLCDYEIFKTVYRYTARTMERTERTVYLLVFTLDGRDQPLQKKDLKMAMTHLQTVIGGSLRKGDAYSRYSATQYIVMLSGVNDDTCHMVAGRLLENFSKMPAHRYSTLSYKLNPVNMPLN